MIESHNLRIYTGMFLEFYRVMPICRFIEKYGPERFEASMNAIEKAGQ